jgi:hypothetical protein
VRSAVDEEEEAPGERRWWRTKARLPPQAEGELKGQEALARRCRGGATR